MTELNKQALRIIVVAAKSAPRSTLSVTDAIWSSVRM